MNFTFKQSIFSLNYYFSKNFYKINLFCKRTRYFIKQIFNLLFRLSHIDNVIPFE